MACVGLFRAGFVTYWAIFVEFITRWAILGWVQTVNWAASSFSRGGWC